MQAISQRAQESQLKSWVSPSTEAGNLLQEQRGSMMSNRCYVFGHVLMVAPLSLQALVDRPDETRRVMNFKRLALTDHKLDVPRLAKKKAIKKALESNGALLQTCSAGAPPRQRAHIGGGTLSQTFNA